MDDSDNDEDDGEGDDMGTEGKCEIDTNETWLARLVRFMAIGLLDPSWEVRHGCSAGLTDLINGLVEGPNGANGAPPHTDNNTVESGELPPVPSFLVEDLICTGLCVLILDGFIDFGNVSVAVSPVKEAVGRLVSVASRCGSLSCVGALFSAVMEMSTCTRAEDWPVRLGSMVLLKYLLPLHAPSLQHSQMEHAIRLVAITLQDESEDVGGTAAQVVRSLCFSLGRCQVHSIPANLAMLRSGLLEGLHCCVLRLNELSRGCPDLCVALAALSVYTQANLALFAQDKPKGKTEGQVDDPAPSPSAEHFFSSLLWTIGSAVGKLPLFSPSIRVGCTSQLITATDGVQQALTLYKGCEASSVSFSSSDHLQAVHELNIAACRLSSVSFLVALSECSKPVGDFHLVSKQEQSRGRREGETEPADEALEDAPTAGLGARAWAGAGAGEKARGKDKALDTTLTTAPVETLMTAGIHLCEVSQRVLEVVGTLGTGKQAKLSPAEIIDLVLNSVEKEQEKDKKEKGCKKALPPLPLPVRVVPAVQPGEAVGDLPEVDLDDILESPEERKRSKRKASSSRTGRKQKRPRANKKPKTQSGSDEGGEEGVVAPPSSSSLSSTGTIQNHLGSTCPSLLVQPRLLPAPRGEAPSLCAPLRILFSYWTWSQGKTRPWPLRLPLIRPHLYSLAGVREAPWLWGRLCSPPVALPLPLPLPLPAIWRMYSPRCRGQ